MTCPPSQWIASIIILPREPEVLLDLICKHLWKVSVLRCEIDLLRRATYCRGWCDRSCEIRERFIILDSEMGVEVLLGSLKVGAGIEIIIAVCKKAAI